jgi:hypothetical protein
MGYAGSGLRDAFEGQGDAGFMAFSYSCFDPLSEVLAPGYFQGCTRMRAGDLIWLGISPRPKNSPWTRHHLATETRRALLMVAGRDEEGRLRVRLVQDFGRPEDPDAPLIELKRGRGRPPKAAA